MRHAGGGGEPRVNVDGAVSTAAVPQSRREPCRLLLARLRSQRACAGAGWSYGAAGCSYAVGANGRRSCRRIRARPLPVAGKQSAASLASARESPSVLSKVCCRRRLPCRAVGHAAGDSLCGSRLSAGRSMPWLPTALGVGPTERAVHLRLRCGCFGQPITGSLSVGGAARAPPGKHRGLLYSWCRERPTVHAAPLLRSSRLGTAHSQRVDVSPRSLMAAYRGSPRPLAPGARGECHAIHDGITADSKTGDEPSFEELRGGQGRVACRT